MKKNRFFSILLSLVIVLGLMPGMSLTAYADDPYASIKNTTTVIKFDGEDWYLMLPELALPVYANSEAQESTGDALGERTFVSVTATGVSTVYDDQLHSGTVVVKTGELNKAYTVYYNTNGVPLTEENYGSYGSPNVPAFKDAGDHTVYYLAVSDGYKPQGGSYTVSIEKAPLSVKAPNAELVYGDSPAKAALNDLSTELSALTITGLKGEDTAEKALSGTPAYSTAYAQYGDVGAYDITLSGLSSSNNYALTLLPGTLTVSPKEVYFTWTGTASFEYNGKEWKLAVPTVNGLVGGDTVTAICSGNAATHAGSYTAKVSGLSGEKAGNYSFAATEATASKAWTITQAANVWTTKPTLLYATGTKAGQYSYLAAAEYGVVVEDGIEYDEESKTYTLSVHVEGTNDFNGIEVTTATYTEPYTPPTTEPTLAENETITLTYGQALFTVENGKYETGYTTDYQTGDPAGTYQIVKLPKDGKVYTPGVITVNKKEVALTWSKPDTFPWDGKEHAVTASVTTGLETGDSVYVTEYDDNKKADAGNYTAYATAFGGTGAENYTITNAGTGYAWSITAATNAFTKELSMSGWTYGESPKEPAAAAKYGAVSYTYYTDSACQTRTTPANSGALAEGGKPVKAGTWYVRASVPADAGAGYRELTSEAVPFTIGKRSLLLTAEDKNSPAGEAIVKLTYTMTGSLAAGDTADGIGIAIATGATSGSSVGTYPITVTVDAEKSANYEVITVDGSYFVASKISVNASGYSQAYDGAEHGITVNVTDPSSGATIKYGESADSCTQAASPTIKNVSDSPKTVYFKVTAENYADYTGSATITISEADAVPATVTANNSAYDGTAHQLISEDKTTLVGGDMQYALGENGSTAPTTGWSTSTPTATNAGTHYVWYKVVGDDNHNDTEPVCVSVKIKKAKAVPATVTANNCTYDGTAQPLVTSGEASGGTMYYAVTTENVAPTDESLYTTSIPSKNDAGTYYVWYKVVGDDNHADTEQDKVKVTISPTDKTALNKAIAAAETYYNSIADNTDYADIAATLKTAIEAAGKAKDDNTTEKAVADAITALNVAVDAAKADVKKTDEKKAADEAAAKKVVDLINALPASAGVSDKEAVKAARDAYDALTPDQKALVDKAKLDAAETQVQAAEAEAAKKAADEAAANSVIDLINALPENAGVGDKEAVAAARAAYDKLTEDQQKLVSKDALTKLTAAEAQVQAEEAKAAEEEAKKEADAKAAQAVIDAIKALPDKAGTGDRKAVDAARAAYEALTDDQKQLVGEDVLKKLTAAEAQVKAAEEAAKQIKISACKITVKDVTYTGKAVTAKAMKKAVTVKYNNKKLKYGTDYTLSYDKKLKAIGPGKVTVKGKGKYSGSKKVSFSIVPKGTAFTKLTGGKQRMTLKWKNPKDIKGYQIEYSLKKDFSGSKKVKINKAKTLTTTIKKLKGKKTYYVRIRTYAKVKNKTYWSAWSKVKTVKTKGGKAKNASAEQVVNVAMNVGEALPLEPLIPSDISDYGLTWNVDDATVATVSREGVVTAIQPGEAAVTMTNADGDRVVFVVTVSAEEVILLDDEPLTLPEIEGIEVAEAELEAELELEVKMPGA